MHVCVTIFRTDSKFQPVSNFTELHAVILAAHSYALLVEVRNVGHTLVITLLPTVQTPQRSQVQEPTVRRRWRWTSRLLPGSPWASDIRSTLHHSLLRSTTSHTSRISQTAGASRNHWLFEAFLFCEFTAACSNCVILGQIYHEWLSHIALSKLAYMSMYHCGRHISVSI